MKTNGKIAKECLVDGIRMRLRGVTDKETFEEYVDEIVIALNYEGRSAVYNILRNESWKTDVGEEMASHYRKLIESFKPKRHAKVSIARDEYEQFRQWQRKVAE